MFDAFIHKNISITYPLFIFGYSRSLSLAINIIFSLIFFIFIQFLIPHSSYIDTYQFFRLNCFVDFYFRFCRRISLNFKNQEQTNLDLLLQHLFICFSFQNGNTEYKYGNVLPNSFMPLFVIAQSNLTYYLFS